MPAAQFASQTLLPSTAYTSVWLYQQKSELYKNRSFTIMVIIDDKPHNWPAAPPPYMQASGSKSQPKPESNNPYNSISNDLLSPGTANSMPASPQRVHFAGGNNLLNNVGAARSTLSFTSHGNVDDPPPFSRGRRRMATLLDLPQHVLLYIVQISCLPRRSSRGYDNFERFHINPDAKGEYRGPPGLLINDGEYDLGEDEWAEHAIGLHHLAMSVRLVSRGLYVGQSARPLMSSSQN